MIACGLDFGTSNSAIGVVRDRMAELAPLEAGNTLMPSAVFFDADVRGRVLFGNEAIEAYIEQADGRLMRALKSILGSPLIDDETSLGKRRLALRDVVEIFVRHLKRKAEAFAGQNLLRGRRRFWRRLPGAWAFATSPSSMSPSRRPITMSSRWSARSWR